MMNNNFFRDQQKNPDMYPPDPLEQREIKAELLKDEQRQKEKEGEGKSESSKKDLGQAPERMHTSLAENYRFVIETVKNLSLKPEFKDDARETAILESRKKIILRTLYNITQDIEDYISQINYTGNENQASYDDVKQYQANISFSDSTRKRLHDKLISDLKMAMKWINIVMNQDFPDNLRVPEEMKLADRKGQSESEVTAALQKRNYLKFPMGLGVVINKENMPRDPQGEREYIMHWAFSFYNDLTKLHDLLNKKEDLD
jgi:hypothetical protein